jgi:hypothetical protein
VCFIESTSPRVAFVVPLHFCKWYSSLPRNVSRCFVLQNSEKLPDEKQAKPQKMSSVQQMSYLLKAGLHIKLDINSLLEQNADDLLGDMPVQLHETASRAATFVDYN